MVYSLAHTQENPFIRRQDRRDVSLADFIIEAGTNVHFYAGDEINLEPGFETEDGAEFETFLGVDPCTKGKLNSNSGITPVIQGENIICGQAEYSSNNKSETKIGWKLTGENANISSYGNEFTTPGTLPNGQYTLYCTAISDNNTATRTKTIQVKCTPHDEQEIIEEEKAVTDSISRNNIVVYPNPNKGIFLIMFENWDNNINANISVKDVSGKIIYSESDIKSRRTSVNISDLRNGVYILNITTDKQVITKKIIKQ